MLGEQLLQVLLDAVLLQAGVDAEVVAGVVGTSSMRIRRVSPVLPAVTVHSTLAVLGGALADRARRAHPVQRLVGAAVGVDQHRPVGLDHQHPGGHRQVGGQPAGVVDLAARNDDSHGPGIYPSPARRRPPPPPRRASMRCVTPDRNARTTSRASRLFRRGRRPAVLRRPRWHAGPRGRGRHRAGTVRAGLCQHGGPTAVGRLADETVLGARAALARFVVLVDLPPRRPRTWQTAIYPYKARTLAQDRGRRRDHRHPTRPRRQRLPVAAPGRRASASSSASPTSTRRTSPWTWTTWSGSSATGPASSPSRSPRTRSGP